jgi:hypothetical protein
MAGMHGYTGPGQSLHLWHLRPFVDVRFVIDLFLQNSEQARRDRMAFSSGANGRMTDAHPISVNVHFLVRKADNDNDRSSGRNLRMPNVITGLEFVLNGGMARSFVWPAPLAGVGARKIKANRIASRRFYRSRA